jgi:hypothetical protein
VYKSINIIGLKNTYLKEYTIERRAIVITLVMAFIGIGITLVGVGVTDISSNLSFSVVGDSYTILGVSYKFVWNRTKRIRRDGNVIFGKRMLKILSKLLLDVGILIIVIRIKIYLIISSLTSKENYNQV